MTPIFGKILTTALYDFFQLEGCSSLQYKLLVAKLVFSVAILAAGIKHPHTLWYFGLSGSGKFNWIAAASSNENCERFIHVRMLYLPLNEQVIDTLKKIGKV